MHPIGATAAIDSPEEQARRERRYRLEEHARVSLNAITNLGSAEDVIEVSRVLQDKAAEVLKRPL